MDKIKGTVNMAKVNGAAQIVFKNRSKFPPVGIGSMLYVAANENKIYRYDKYKAKYVCIGTNPDSLQNQIDNIVIETSDQGDVSAEVFQARVDVSGNNFSNLKKRLDSEEKNTADRFEEIEKDLQASGNRNILAEYYGTFTKCVYNETGWNYNLSAWGYENGTFRFDYPVKFTIAEGYELKIITFKDGVGIIREYARKEAVIPQNAEFSFFYRRIDQKTVTENDIETISLYKYHNENDYLASGKRNILAEYYGTFTKCVYNETGWNYNLRAWGYENGTFQFDYPVKFTIADGYELKIITFKDGVGIIREYARKEAVIPQNTEFSFFYRRIDLEQVTDDDLETVYLSQYMPEMVKTDTAISRLSKVELLSGAKFPVEATFVNGDIYYGKLRDEMLYRVSSWEILSYPVDVFIHVADGFYIVVHYLDDNGEFVSTSGKKGIAHAIPANQKFRLMITRQNENESEIADIDEFTSAIEISGDNSNDFGISLNYMQIFPKYTVIGDSLACGYMKVGDLLIDSETAKNAKNNWVHYLELRTGRTFTNVSVGGTTAKDWREGLIETANIDTDCYIIGMGVNDKRQEQPIGTSSDIAVDFVDNADSYYGNLDYMVRQCMAWNPAAHVFLFTMPPIEGVPCNDYNEAIRHIANLYQDRVHCIDLYFDYGIYFKSGIVSRNYTAGHFNPITYNYMSGVIEYAINKFMHENDNLFSTAPYA